MPKVYIKYRYAQKKLKLKKNDIGAFFNQLKVYKVEFIFFEFTAHFELNKQIL